MATLAERITETETRLSQYIQAERAITSGAQEYSIGNRSLTRADLRFIAKQIIALNTQLNTLNNGNRIRMQRIVPRDGI